MQPSDRGNAADYADREAAEMGRILVLGAALGVPMVFVITLLLVFAAGARGAGTIFGPLIGTTLFIIIREVVSTHWEHHSLIVGVVAILVVILAPNGIVGLWRDWLARFEERGPEVDAQPASRAAAP